MPDYFATARAWLAALDPAAPAAALILTVFLAIYALRRWAPGVWLAIESKVPFAGSLDYRPFATIVGKIGQAVPGALFGAAVAALSSGASVKNALLGVLAGFAASGVHEVMSAYQGQVGGPPKPPSASIKSPTRISFSPPKSPSFPPDTAAIAIGFLALVSGVALCLSLSGCGLFGSRLPAAEQCAPTPASLAAQVADILLAGGDYASALEQLALKDTESAIVCAVEAFLGNPKLGASPADVAAKERGHAYLKAKGVQ